VKRADTTVPVHPALLLSLSLSADSNSVLWFTLML